MQAYNHLVRLQHSSILCTTVGLGRRRYTELFEDIDENTRQMLLDAYILQTEAKHFKNLHLQENRLRRQYRQDLQELKELQAERQKEQEADPAPSRTPQEMDRPKPAMASNLQTICRAIYRAAILRESLPQTAFR